MTKPKQPALLAAPARPELIIAHDASWTGWGWAVCRSRQVLACGHVAINNKAWRWDALRNELAQLDEVVNDFSATFGERPRVVVETAPAVYKGRRGNQASTGQGLGQINGAIQLWGTRPMLWGYPWTVAPADWRPWWVRGKAPKGREAWKAWAVAMVRMLGHGSQVAPYPWTGDDGGAQGDVAEAILIGLGAADRVALAPRGPAAWKAA